MASSGGDARSKRAQARGERRAKSSQKGPAQKQAQHEEPRSGESGGNGGTTLSTPKLVAAGAAAGALLGTAKAVLDRRNAQGDDAGDDFDEHEEHEEHEQETRGRAGKAEQSSEQPAGVRGLLVSVLEAALDAVQEPGQARHEREGGDEERTREEEDDDEEAEREPRAEHTHDGRPAARGESTGEAGRAAAQGEGDGGADAAAAGRASRADAGAAGGDPRADEESDEPVSRGTDGEEDADDDDEPGARVGERPLDEDAEPIVAAQNGDGGATEILARARQQITALVGREPESTSRVEHVDGGWRLAFEVVEVPRVPPTTDVMASYSVALDESGNVLEYGRTERYYRNRAEGGG